MNVNLLQRLIPRFKKATRLELTKKTLSVIIYCVLMGFNASATSATTAVAAVEFKQQQVQVTGAVTDVQGTPLPGVSVKLKGTNVGAGTDMQGRYSLKVPANGTLVFTYIGFASQEIKIGGRTSIDVKLKESSNELDAVVVVGFGRQKKANLTGSVSTIDSKALAARPVANVSQALQGAMPGLNIQTTGLGGELNQGLSLNIRGAGSIGKGSTASPLVLIDGMEGDLNSLNVQDIESITTLKDAASSSIYGSRAPFGVILVTTKRGKSGKATINYNNNLRWNSPIGLPEMLDSRSFAEYYNEAALNGGQGAVFSSEMIKKIEQFKNGEINYATEPNKQTGKYEYYTGSFGNTDWFKEQWKSNSFSNDHSLSMSGGSENIQYYASGAFLDQGGILRHGGDNLKRYNLSGRINATLTKHVKFNYSTRYSREDYQRPTHMIGIFYHNIARRWPTVPAKDPNGHWSEASEIAQLEDGGRSNDQRDINYQQGQLQISPLKGWNIFAEGNLRVTNTNNHSDMRPAYYYDKNQNPDLLSVGYENPPGRTNVYEYNYKNNFFSTNIYTDYEFDVNRDHHFKVLGGFNSDWENYQTIGASRDGLIVPDVPTINTGTTESKATEGEKQHWATAGFFGRLNYNYKGRYLLEANGRYDGSSRFLKDKRWNFFPSVSVGWNVSQESFWPLQDQIDQFKLRASYGELGNQNTRDLYPFYSKQPFSANRGSWLLGENKPNTSNAPGLVSDLLTWERVTSWNVGFDLSALRSRLTINLDYFNRNTFDMVGPAPELPAILGTDVPLINNADMKSYGFELEAKWQDRVGAFGYSVRGVLSDDQQKITRYPNPTGSLSKWYDNQKMGDIWGYTTLGIAKTQAEMDAHLEKVSQSDLGSNWTSGDIMYADLNGDGKINSGGSLLSNHGDLSIIGNSTPRYRFSLDLGADFKGFDLRVFLQGIGKRDFMAGGPYFWGANGGMWQSAGFKHHMDYFRDENSPSVKSGFNQPNTNAFYPRPYFSGADKNQKTQTRYLQNASYMRLKNLQIGYSLPKPLLAKIGVGNMRVYVSGDNLATFTDMIKIFDPESVGLGGWSDGKTYPLSRVYSLGLNVNF